jgi:acetylornithine deacetylase/succinyl-diaminopimelate desuccinylase-like protein
MAKKSIPSGVLYARSAGDDKAPIAAILNVAEGVP